jgi:hypothetical protein
MFQIARHMLDANGDIIARRPLQPLYELRDHATAMARNEASGLWGDYGYDDQRDAGGRRTVAAGRTSSWSRRSRPPTSRHRASFAS